MDRKRRTESENLNHNPEESGKTIPKFLGKGSIVMDTSSKVSSSPGSIGRAVDRTGDQGRILLFDPNSTNKALPIFEEVLEEDEPGSKSLLWPEIFRIS